MKSEVEKLGGLTRRLNVEVPPEVVSSELEKMYIEVQRNAKFKGFRPGHAPMHMVKTEYRSKVESDVATHMIQHHFGKALHEHSLSLVGYPDIEFSGLKEGEPLKFSATFEVRPQIDLKEYTGLEVEKEVLQIKPEVIDSILQDIRKSKASFVPLIELRSAQMGDVAVIDFHGRVDSADLPNGSAQEYMLELGSKHFFPGFEEGIVGMNPGQSKNLKLQFPTDYHEKNLAGRPVEFAVTLKEIKRKVLPELDDDFVKSLGGHETLEQLRAEIVKDVTEREQKRVNDDVKNRVLHQLVDMMQFEVPRTMLQEQKEILIEDVHHRMENQGMPHEQFEEYKKKWDKDFDQSAEFVLRSSLIVNAIAKKENLYATDQEMDARMQEYASQTKIELGKIRAFYAKPESNNRLRFQMTEDKVMAFLISKAKIKELPREKLSQHVH